VNGFAPLPSLAGGALIGLASAWFLLANGRVAGISGLVAGLLPRGDGSGRADRGAISVGGAFVAGLLAGGGVLLLVLPSAFEPLGEDGATLARFAAAGLLVGFGSRLGGGCTSGHGVCGLGFRSVRSLAATLTFMGVAGVVVFVRLHLLGGSR
jgi:uncharacterized membrane protein YedE/YeeE